MNIAMLVSHMDEEMGGHEFYLCKELAKKGHKVTLYTSTNNVPGYRKKKYKEGITTSDGFIVKRYKPTIEISHIPVFPLRYLWDIRNDQPDIIHSHEFFQFCSFYATLLSKKHCIPFVLTQHGHKLPMNKFLHIPYKMHLQTIGKYNFNAADGVIALTNDVKEFLLSQGIPSEKIRVISTGISIDIFSPDVKPSINLPKNVKKLLFVGRLVENKGILYLIRSLRKIKEEVKDIKLIIVGEGELREKCMKLANDLSLTDNILFLGRVNQKDMPSIYASADVFVLPTVNREPFGIAAAEALACGVPVVASSIDGLKYTVDHGKNGFLCNPGDIDCLAYSIVNILKNEALRNEFKINARLKAVNELSWEIKAEQILDLYKKVIALKEKQHR